MIAGTDAVSDVRGSSQNNVLAFIESLQNRVNGVTLPIDGVLAGHLVKPLGNQKSQLLCFFRRLKDNPTQFAIIAARGRIIGRIKNLNDRFPINRLRLKIPIRPPRN